MNKLPIQEELDFAYLLELMVPLKQIPEYALLPELFSIIGHERLLLLCKYAGGETVSIPTIQELSDCIEALQWFYDVYIKKTKSVSEIPNSYKESIHKIREVYDSKNN